jgi:two-component system, cell cycle sensor histidine kinase and response regulator CckA
LHKLLARQLQRYFGSLEQVPGEIRGFLGLVDAAYVQADQDRAQLERSLETLSDELVERYRDLRDEQARYRILADDQSFGPIFDRAGVGMKVVSLNGEILHTNRAFERFIGAEPRELIRRRADDLSPPEDAAATQAALADLLANRVESTQLDKRYVHKDGRMLVGRLTLTLVRSPTGDPLYAMAMVEDVTERIRMQEALSASEAQLRQAQKMDAIGRLAGGVAHDFNNLLTAILAPVELARIHLEPNHPVLEDLDDIRTAAQRAVDLTGQLLTFSRQEVLSAEVLDLNQIVEETVRLLRRVLDARTQLVVSLNHSLGSVRADRTQLHQVVMNLALNARDAMPDGGTLTIETREVELDAAYADHRITVRPGRYVLLAVSDTGSGMDQRTLDQIFEPFFTTKARGKGSGLGLTTAHGIVTQAGGRIGVYSELGRGTTFKVYLPLVDAAASAPVHVAPAAGGSETILLVEDDEVVLKISARTLKRAGYRILPASNGLAALEQIEKHREEISLVLTDVIMPVMTGSELAARLAEVAPEIPMLFMSGYADEAIVQLGAIAPGSPFLQKPFTPGALTAKVRAVLDAGRGLLGQSTSRSADRLRSEGGDGEGAGDR